MTIQYTEGRFTITTATTHIHLSQTELVILLRFFNAVPHYDSVRLLEKEATIILNNNIDWFQEWDDLTSFERYTKEDWENLLDACPPPRVVQAIDRFRPIFSDN